MSAAARKIAGSVAPLRCIEGGHGRADHAEVINLLRDVAAELEGDPSVRGVVIIVDRDDRPAVQHTVGGRMRRFREKLAVTLYRVAHSVLDHDEDE